MAWYILKKTWGGKNPLEIGFPVDVGEKGRANNIVPVWLGKRGYTYGCSKVEYDVHQNRGHKMTAATIIAGQKPYNNGDVRRARERIRKQSSHI